MPGMITRCRVTAKEEPLMLIVYRSVASPIPEAVLDITGSPPRTFRRWVEGHAAAFLADSAKDRPED
jgi:hypothetical protein